MKKSIRSLYTLVFTALMAAIVCVVTFVRIPLLGSKVHLGKVPNCLHTAGNQAVGCILTADQLMEPAARFRAWQHGKLMKKLQQLILETFGFGSDGFCPMLAWTDAILMVRQ